MFQDQTEPQYHPYVLREILTKLPLPLWLLLSPEENTKAKKQKAVILIRSHNMTVRPSTCPDRREERKGGEGWKLVQCILKSVVCKGSTCRCAILIDLLQCLHHKHNVLITTVEPR